MKEEQIVDLWMCFKEFIDKKQLELAAEKYVDLLADYGVDDIVLKDALGNDDYLDGAIEYYLELDDEWDE
jgi:hypothetical protein